MKVLVACEFSGIVRDAFARRGHDAWSCDLLPTERQGNHIQDDVLKHLDEGWDLMIAHPPCTFLCNSGVRWLHERPARWRQMAEAIVFFNGLLNVPIPRLAVENPIQHKYARAHIRRPDQIVQPYHFGDMESKATCLWLKGLPPLMASFSGGEGIKQSVFRTSPSEHRGLLRSRTFMGIAEAMAEQWGKEL